MENALKHRNRKMPVSSQRMMRILEVRANCFWRDVRNVRATQESVLGAIVNKEKDTRFGKRHQFASIGSAREYMCRVPLTTYEDYRDDILAVSQGERNVLTCSAVQLFQPTSGSTDATKYIPYTAMLRRRYSKAIAVWLHDLFKKRPLLLSGSGYWQITPPGQPEGSRFGCIPVGFDTDMQYFGMPERAHICHHSAVPPIVSAIRDMDSFRYATLLYLLHRHDLTFVSIWNPTFLRFLLEPLRTATERLLSDLSTGEFNPPGDIGIALRARIRRGFRANRKRRAQVEKAISTANGYSGLWPQLTLISCWADGNAASYVDGVASLFPSVEIQPKGLLATEACVSIPVLGKQGHVPAIQSHYLEFIDIDATDARTVLVHELEPGRNYSVVVTNGGGLYRYQLKDIVEVSGFHRNLPLLKFIGKEDCVSDHMGEKLNEAHVRTVIGSALRALSIPYTFFLLAPERDQNGLCRYLLFLETPLADKPDRRIKTLAKTVEKGLRENFHYSHCRDLGQLQEVRVFWIEKSCDCAADQYLRAMRGEGRRLGNVKNTSLSVMFGWSKRFKGKLISKGFAN